MVAYDKRPKATIAQRQRNLLVEHLEDIRGAIKKVAFAKGLDIVLNSSETQRVFTPRMVVILQKK